MGHMVGEQALKIELPGVSMAGDVDNPQVKSFGSSPERTAVESLMGVFSSQLTSTRLVCWHLP